MIELQYIYIPILCTSAALGPLPYQLNTIFHSACTVVLVQPSPLLIPFVCLYNDFAIIYLIMMTYYGNHPLVRHAASPIRRESDNCFPFRTETSPFRTSARKLIFGLAHPKVKEICVVGLAPCRKLVGLAACRTCDVHTPLAIGLMHSGLQSRHAGINSLKGVLHP